jgi:DNA-binding LacI/PurR family transcriptional regulator
MKITRPPLKQLELKGKRQELCEQITHLVYRLGSGERLPRVAEMCRDFNVAPNTLNHALREVEEQGLITRRRGAGIFVAEISTNWTSRAPLALICRPSFFRSSGHSPIWDLLLEMIQQHAAKSGAHFDCYFSREEGVKPPLSATLMRAIERREIGGVLGVGLPEAGAVWIMSHGVPVVNLFGPGHVVIMLDSGGMIQMCVDALQRQGCRRIALWMTAPYHRRTDVGAFKSALSSHGLEVLPELIEVGESGPKQLSLSAPSGCEQGFTTALQVFGRPRPEWPDGIVIGDDTMTRGALMAMRRMKLKAGRDVLVASHANAGSPVLMGEEGLSLAEFDPAEIVAEMFKHIERLMRHLPEDLNKQEAVDISAHLREDKTRKNPAQIAVAATAASI